jgi:hypothetical protein
MITGYWLFLCDFALVFYVLGATFIEGFVNYRTWHLIGAADFRAFHQAVGPRILAFLVAPHSLTVVLTCLLLWWRPGPIPAWTIWVSLLLNLLPLVVTFASQVPIQLEFDRKGLSLPQLQRLIRREWLRSVPHMLNAVLFLWMMAQVLAAGLCSHGAACSV